MNDFNLQEPEEGFEDTDTGGRPRGPLPWDPSDPIFSTTDLFRWLERSLRYTGTIGVLAHLFGNAVLDGSDVGAAIRNMAVRRLVEVFPPPTVLEKLPPHRRYFYTLMPEEKASDLEAGLVLVQPEKIYGRHGLGWPEGQRLVCKDQRWFVFSGTKSQWYCRTYRTGLLRMSRKDVEEEFQRKVRELRDGGRFTADADPLTPEEQLRLDFSLSQARLEQSRKYSVHRTALELFVNNEPAVQFDSQDLWNFWERLRNLAGETPKERELLPPGLTLGEVRFQSVEESVAAAEAMWDTFSTVLQEPLIEEYEAPYSEQFLCGVLRGDVELVVFASANEWNDVRKIVDMRKVRLGWQRKLALALVDKGEPFGIGDKWPFGPMGDVRVKDLIFAPEDPKDPDYVPTTYIGPLAALPRDFNLGDGNRLFTIHAKVAEKVSRAINSIENDLLGKVESGEPIHYQEVEKLPLINWAPEDIYFTYWEKDSRGNLTVPHTPAEWVAAGKPDWEPHGVPRFDWALWANWRYVTEHLHLIAYQAATLLNEQAERLGLNSVIPGESVTIPTRYDGTPETNFFDLERPAWQVWRLQPLGPIERIINFHIGEAKENREVDLLSIFLKLVDGFPSGRQGRNDIEEMFWAKRKDIFFWMDDRMAEQHNFLGMRQFRDFVSWMAKGLWTRIGDTPEARMEGVRMLQKAGFWLYMSAKAGDTIQGLGESHDYLNYPLEQKADMAALIRSRSLTRSLATDKNLDKRNYTNSYLRYEISLRLKDAGFDSPTWRQNSKLDGATARVAEKIRATEPKTEKLQDYREWEKCWEEVRKFILDNLPSGRTEDDIDFRIIRSWYYTFHSLLVYKPSEVLGEASS